MTQQAHAEGWIVVHDCAHAFSYGLRLSTTGATVAFSLPKLFPVSSGGLLANGPGFESADVCKSTESDRGWLTSLLAQASERSTRHVAHWQRLDRIANASGLGSVDHLAPGVIPQAYRLRVTRQFAASQQFASRLIESTPPFYVGWLALPCHANLSDHYWQAVEVALAAYRQERAS
ncbi:MAG TPA: hypothetical protein VNG11_05500 [Chloroflexota bacterium]|nr:hypothetical protein [Chloroflexota bacterium]